MERQGRVLTGRMKWGHEDAEPQSSAHGSAPSPLLTTVIVVPSASPSRRTVARPPPDPSKLARATIPVNMLLTTAGPVAEVPRGKAWRPGAERHSAATGV